MTNIDYLPKFYNKKDIIVISKTVKICIEELKASNKLTKKEIEELDDFDMTDCADAYSRNYIIRRIKELQSFIFCRN